MELLAVWRHNKTKNQFSCAYLRMSMWIGSILSLFINVCFSYTLSWIICIECIFSFSFHHLFAVCVCVYVALFGWPVTATIIKSQSFVLVCYTATRVATQLPQRRIQVVRSNRVARKRPAESNSTPAMDPGHIDLTYTFVFYCEEDIRIRRHTSKRGFFWGFGFLVCYTATQLAT